MHWLSLRLCLILLFKLLLSLLLLEQLLEEHLVVPNTVFRHHEQFLRLADPIQGSLGRDIVARDQIPLLFAEQFVERIPIKVVLLNVESSVEGLRPDRIVYGQCNVLLERLPPKGVLQTHYFPDRRRWKEYGPELLHLHFLLASEDRSLRAGAPLPLSALRIPDSEGLVLVAVLLTNLLTVLFELLAVPLEFMVPVAKPYGPFPTEVEVEIGVWCRDHHERRLIVLKHNLGQLWDLL